MTYTTPATDAVLAATAEALRGHNIEPHIVSTKEEALALIKKLIPPGASVTNGASRTLAEIGFVEYLKAGQHGWHNLHEAILKEEDPAKQTVLRRQAALADFYLGSVHALTQEGEMLIGSNTGSQLPNIVYTSPNLIFIVGAQKVVPTLADAQKRLWERVIPLEDARMKEAHGPQAGTKLNKELIFHGESTFNGRKVHVVLVKEALGF